MPDNEATKPLTPAEEKKVHEPTEKWSDTFAKKVVVQDFQKAAMFRASNHDWRWKNADTVYLAWSRQRHWEGTRVPRSSLNVFLAFEQIESLLPQVMAALFGDYPAWFLADALPGTSPQEARLVRELLIHQMDNQREVTGSIRSQLRRAFKSGFVYGNGFLELTQKYSEIERPFFEATFEPITESRTFNGRRIQAPTGETRRVINESTRKEVFNQPVLRYVPIKDLYIDANTQGPDLRESRFVIKRAKVSVDEIDRLREQPGFNIPTKSQLLELARLKLRAQGDQTRENVENVRGNTYNSTDDTSIDPASKSIELLPYWTEERLVWVLNREEVVFNQPNPFGFKPFYNVFYADVLDRVYGLAITDIVEGDQRLIQNIINARIDELSLSIHAPRIKRRGISVPNYALRRKPGQVVEVENPQTDIVTEEPQNITAQAFAEIDAAERRVQKYTGAFDLSVIGAPPGRTGNAAARTATGVSVQAAASGSRIAYIVENNEQSPIETFLQDWHTLNVLYLDPHKFLEVIGGNKSPVRVDPLIIKNSSLRFTMRAASRIRARAALLQSLPFIQNTMLNPSFLQLLARQQGKTINVEELANMIYDATNYRPKEGFFRDLTEQEQQALNQPPPEEQLRMQMQRERLAAQASEGDEGRTADLGLMIAEKSLDAVAAEEGEEENASE